MTRRETIIAITLLVILIPLCAKSILVTKRQLGEARYEAGERVRETMTIGQLARNEVQQAMKEHERKFHQEVKNVRRRR
jgi:hypothetical protein